MKLNGSFTNGTIFSDKKTVWHTLKQYIFTMQGQKKKKSTYVKGNIL